MIEIKNILESALVDAGATILSYRAGKQAIENKESNEIVTPADIASNDLVIARLQKAFPDIPVYTEEGEENKSQAETRWIIDPLDGTTPWVWGNSGFSISVALEDKGQVAVGAVYDPVMKEFFYAEKGQGATKNGDSITVADSVPLSEALVVMDWGNSQPKREEGFEYYRKFMLPEMVARRIVPQFAPALGLCRVAEGRIHALVCNDTWIEDHAAGSLILQEAGGVVSNFYDTDTFTHREPGIIATNSLSLHEQIIKVLRT